MSEPHTIVYSKEKLDRLIADFRSALRDPCACIDPRPAGEQLYELLIKPIEGDLAGAEATTLLWSLDGALRYIPIAALWNKQRQKYMVELYKNVTITLAKTDDLDDKRKPVGELRALGAGVSKKIGAFRELKAVQDELKNVVRKENAEKKEEEWGVIAGDRLLDEDFSLKSFQDAIKKYSVIHIASHFDFRPGNERASVLLLGDGGFWSLRDVSSDSQAFIGVELLTLSACNTANSGSGSELEGFAGMAQVRGAKAVLATLWAVADRSTGVLMKQFYTNLRDKPDMTKAEALQQAQLDLLHGRVKIPSALDDLRENNDGKTDEVKPVANYVPGEKSPRSHPYYWAPFILIGNWK
jgi:CHAT domain-containing protein